MPACARRCRSGKDSRERVSPETCPNHLLTAQQEESQPILAARSLRTRMGEPSLTNLLLPDAKSFGTEISCAGRHVFRHPFAAKCCGCLSGFCRRSWLFKPPPSRTCTSHCSPRHKESVTSASVCIIRCGFRERKRTGTALSGIRPMRREGSPCKPLRYRRLLMNSVSFTLSQMLSVFVRNTVGSTPRSVS